MITIADRNHSYHYLLGACVEICLPPLQLIDGQCIEVDLGIASDLVDKVTEQLDLGGLTKNLVLGGLL